MIHSQSFVCDRRDIVVYDTLVKTTLVFNVTSVVSVSGRLKSIGKRALTKGKSGGSPQVVEMLIKNEFSCVLIRFP